MLNSILKVIRGIVKLRGGTDNSLIGNVGDRLKVTDDSGLTFLNVLSANIYKQNEATIASKTETDLSGVTYTVPSGKTFVLTTLTGSYDAQSTVYIRLKKQTGGSGAFATITRIVLVNGGQGDPTVTLNYGNGLLLGTSGDVFKITYEAAVVKGVVWAQFTGAVY